MTQEVVPLEPDHIPDELKCSICFGVPLSPAVTPCDHLFCHECLQSAVAVSPVCPICRESSSAQQLRPLPKGSIAYRIWSSIKVKCSQHEKGCVWTGSIADAANHAVKCRELRSSESKRHEKEMSMMQEKIGQLEMARFCLQTQYTELQAKYTKLKSDPLLELPVLFDGTYNYDLDRNRASTLSQLIARYLTRKPKEIDSDRIFQCVQNCYQALKGKWPNNPERFSIDMRMLLTTCAACTWFNHEQAYCISRWLHEQGWD